MIYVTEPYLPDIKKYKKYLDEIYARNWLTNNGPLVQELTIRLEKHLDVKNLLLVSNGTLALQIACRVLGLNGKILTSPFSFVATVSSQLWEGLEVEFSDIDAHTFNMCPELIQKSISEEIEAILPVHVFGNPCEVERIEELANKHNLKVIYDAAHAFGVKYKGKSILQHGDISVLSFHATKAFHCVEGGALVFKDDALFQLAKSMINFGYENGNITRLGINAKMSELHAAMGLCVLDDIDEIVKQRKEIYIRYLKALSGHVKFQAMMPESELNYSYFPILLECENSVLEVIKIMSDNDIIPRRYFYPSLNELSYLNNYSCMSNSEDISKHILCLPIFPGLQEDQQEKIIQILLTHIVKETK